MEFKHYVGIDVSKNTLDVAVIMNANDVPLHIQISNDNNGFKQLTSWFKKIDKFDFCSTLFCMEHTGIYNNPVLGFLLKLSCTVWVENAVHIQKTIGLQRGKNDKVDAHRIAVYATKNKEELNPYKPRRQSIEQLKVLSSLRDQLIGMKKEIKSRINEYQKFGDKTASSLMLKTSKQTQQGIEKDLKNLEKEILKIITSDEQLNQMYELMKSVVGVGHVTALQLIVHTNEMTLVNNPRSLACHCGVAPFERSSGLFKGKARVSHMANKRLKTALHMAALSAMKLDKELKIFYERKVAEGKSKMSVINAIRNKLIHRIFAVIKRQTPYQNDYQPIFNIKTLNEKNIQNSLVLS
ncbi:MAG: IS110 family transposase [Bacteroidia bacterium]|nr:MAG: IS110 family transposase [Bacteroidia bacterium]